MSIINYIYVANSGDNTVDVVNPSDNSIISTITVGSSPYGVAITPNGNYVYVANSYVTTVSVILLLILLYLLLQ